MKINVDSHNELNRFSRIFFPGNPVKLVIGRFSSFLLCLVLLFLSVGCKKIGTQAPEPQPVELTDQQKALVAELNGMIYPISGSLYLLEDSELSPLDYLKDVKIVGLGEATHGTKDFFQMKHRVFKYLVERLGFRAFAFESDFGESIYLDRYVTTGQGDIGALMKQKMLFWTWTTEEVKWLLEWMWEYNKDKPKGQMIRYLGVDSQSMKYQGELLIQYLETVSPSFLATLRTFLEYTGTLGREKSFDELTDTEWSQLEIDIKNLSDSFMARESEFVAVSGREEFELAKQLIRNLEQTRVTWHGITHDIPTNYRDSYMAENTVWVREFMGTDEKVALWAHNEHIANNYYYGSSGSIGMYLKNQFGDDYQILGFSFAKGSFNAIFQNSDGSYGQLQTFTVDSDPVYNSINQIFYHAQYDDFIFRLSDMPPDSQLRNWLLENRRIISIGSIFNDNIRGYYHTQPLLEFYDVFIHFNFTSAAGEL